MAVSDPEFVVRPSRGTGEPTGNRPDLAGPVRDCGGRQGVGVDLGPEERRLYRLTPRNQGVPATPRVGYEGAAFQPGNRLPAH